MRVISRFLVIVTLCSAIGLHWCVLQSVAWTTMMVAYAKDCPLSEALVKTFDGQHPCSLCHVVQAGKKSEQKNNVRVVTKIDLSCAPASNPPVHDFLPVDYPTDAVGSTNRVDSPLTPPPRVAA